MVRSLAGTRVRERRLKLGISQNALAKAVRISPSYLNLIEHNRRGIAGRVLVDVARELGVAPADLTEGPEMQVASELREALAMLQPDGVDPVQIDAFSSGFPGWALWLSRLVRQNLDQQAAIRSLSDRLTHDPFLAENLHDMLSKITAIRSTSGILDSMADIDADRRKRFNRAIHQESLQLSEAARALVEYFDHSADTSGSVATPEEEVDQHLARHGYCFPEIDANLADDAVIDRLIGESERLRSAAAQRLARSKIQEYRDDAELMPLSMFQRMAKMHDYNPIPLAKTFAVPLPAVFRRLAGLRREGIDAPEMGLLIANAAGHTLHRRPVTGFPLPRHGDACPLWPMFTSFSQPGRPLLDQIALPDNSSYHAISIATPRGEPGFDRPPDLIAAMLIVPEAQAARCGDWLGQSPEPAPVGTNCRICPRRNCSARAEAGLMPEAD